MLSVLQFVLDLGLEIRRNLDTPVIARILLWQFSWNAFSYFHSVNVQVSALYRKTVITHAELSTRLRSLAVRLIFCYLQTSSRSLKVKEASAILRRFTSPSRTFYGCIMAFSEVVWIRVFPLENCPGKEYRRDGMESDRSRTSRCPWTHTKILRCGGRAISVRNLKRLSEISDWHIGWSGQLVVTWHITRQLRSLAADIKELPIRRNDGCLRLTTWLRLYMGGVASQKTRLSYLDCQCMALNCI